METYGLLTSAYGRALHMSHALACLANELFLEYAAGLFQGAELGQVSTPTATLMGRRRMALKAGSDSPSLPNNHKLLHYPECQSVTEIKMSILAQRLLYILISFKNISQ